MRLGYKASAEQFEARELLRFALLAEQLGFDTVGVSDDSHTTPTGNERKPTVSGGRASPSRGKEKMGVEDPLELERLADANRARASSRFIVSDDPDEVADRVAGYVELGFDALLFHAPGHDQRRAWSCSRETCCRASALRFGVSSPRPVGG